KVTDPTKKAELQADLNKAQAQLDAKAAQTEAENKAREAVNNLFTNKDPNGNITGTLTQANIDAAQALVNKVTDPTKKAELQADLNKAQAQLDAKTVQTEAENKAREAVNNLFTNKDPNGNITGTLTQANIDAAQALVNKVTDPAKKATLQADLNKAQAQLDAKTAQTEAENKAREAVNNLFTNKDPNGNITGTLTQANIDAAQALVNKVTDPTKKAELQRDLDRAQELLDARNAVIAAEKARQEVALKAVNELFNNDKPSTDMIKDTTTQATIDAAQKLIDAVTDSAVKAGLQKDLDRAQALLNDRLSTVGTITPADFLIGGDKYVTGTFTGSVAKISLLVNDKEYTGGAVKADGTFTFYANDKNIKKTDAVFAVAYDKNGKELERTKVTFVIVTAGKITPATYNLASDRNITGTYTEDVTKVTVTVDGKVYKGGTVANGAFTFYAFDKIKNATDVVTVQAYDQSGKLLDTKTLKIIANVVVTKGSITPNTLTIPSDKNITGTYTDDVNYVVVNVDGTDYKGGTFTAGEFKFYSFDKITSASSNVTIQAYDKAGKLLDTKNLKLVGAEKPNVTSGSIDLNLLTLGTDKSITGTYTGDVKSVEVTVNGTAYKGGTFVEGEFKFYSFDKIKSVADNVTIKALDATGKVVDTKVLQIAAK
ncbi:hypothetical protein HB848_09390, partial [Listeria rocourtiae]|uniref:immunoglobulin-like domain-containing protein n=1 Tax=Listeria rocourtiae TaxID=647910 RepID=UPI0018205EC2